MRSRLPFPRPPSASVPAPASPRPAGGAWQQRRPLPFEAASESHSPPFLRFPLLPAAHQNSPFPPFLRPPLPVMQGVPGSSVDPCPGANQPYASRLLLPRSPLAFCCRALHSPPLPVLASAAPLPKARLNSPAPALFPPNHTSPFLPFPSPLRALSPSPDSFSFPLSSSLPSSFLHSLLSSLASLAVSQQGGCFSRGDYCDGVKNCADGSDEWPWICSFDMDCGALNATHVLCPDSPSVCILPGQYCDGKNRLPGRARRKPRFCANFTCPRNSLRCPGLSTCKPGGALCNAVPTARENLLGVWLWMKIRPSAGYTCPKGSSKCSDNLQCVDDVLRCNGVKECKDGSDEVGCDKWNCTKGFRKCKDQLQCVSKLNWCNKVADCKAALLALAVAVVVPANQGPGHWQWRQWCRGGSGSGAGKPGGGSGSGSGAGKPGGRSGSGGSGSGAGKPGGGGGSGSGGSGTSKPGGGSGGGGVAVVVVPANQGAAVAVGATKVVALAAREARPADPAPRGVPLGVL
ncbi:unnamed protein product [Closterium sp. NIES-64]|nr:unnamed protein product [Closterium sp. NIES-64]